MEETYATCTLFVPRGTKEAYRAAAPWSKFRHIEEFDYEFAAEIFWVEGSEKKIVKCFDKQVSSYTVPSGTTSIGGGAFAGCSNLKTVAFASSVSSIGAGAFAHCRLLSSITLSSTLTIIEPYAFYGCLMLGEVKMGARIPPQIDETVFEGCYRNCILYVPRGSKEAYASTHPWSLFYRIEEYDPEPDAIEAIESDGATVIDRYTMNGQRITSPLKGVNLLRMSDGTVRKVLVK